MVEMMGAVCSVVTTSDALRLPWERVANDDPKTAGDSNPGTTAGGAEGSAPAVPTSIAEVP